jgi:hypothetical protein
VTKVYLRAFRKVAHVIEDTYPIGHVIWMDHDAPYGGPLGWARAPELDLVTEKSEA